MNRSSLNKHFDFFIIDEISLFLSFIFAFGIYVGNISNILDSITYRTLVLVILFIDLCLTSLINPHSNILKTSSFNIFFQLIQFSFVQLMATTFFLFATKQGSDVSRICIALTYIFFVFIALVLRILRKRMILNKKDATNSKRIFIITTTKKINDLLLNIKNNNHGLYKIAGICILDKDLKDTTIDTYKIVANKKDVLSYLCTHWVDEVFIDIESKNTPKEILAGLASAGITTSIVTERIEEFGGREHHFDNLFNQTVSTFSIKTRSTIDIISKRILDIVGGIVGSLIALLLMLIIGPMIKCASKGPIFYKQERIGLNGKHFYMYKFRSMEMNADSLKDSLKDQNRIKDGMMFKVKNDPRIIPGIGTSIRQTSLDEFPQFFNVLKGDMSLVGTRPPTIDEWEKYKLEHRIRMSIKPGITGLWQVNGRSKITDFNKVIEYDTKYINSWSLGLDIEILFRTVYVILFKKREDEAL